ncbi:hypothetical protein [Microvirga massiliensis]|uniref:hypothetical protein n=1 Tax=Microvirga massiliensis TaxID=1033741 RepID=UPI00062B65E6|nr:hypothetical protein [Microvirga massiliensis]
MAIASHQSITAALRYIDSMLLDTFSDIVGTDLRRAGTSPIGRDSANTIVLTDASGSATMILRGSDVHDELDEDTLQPEANNFSFGEIRVRWYRSVENIEDASVLTVDQLTALIQQAGDLFESIRATAESFPDFRDKILRASEGGLWRVQIDASTRDVQSARRS